jgi:hypothetical protein
MIMCRQWLFYIAFPLRNERGIALLTVLAIVLLLTFVGTVAVITSKTEVDISGVERTEKMAFYAAEAGLEEAIGEILNSYETYGIPPDPVPSGQMELNGYTVNFTTAVPGTLEFKTLTNGAYKGLYASVRTFTVEAEATGGAYGARARISQVIEDALIPIFQFAVFYEMDLEISPGPVMTMAGRIHTNADMYLQSEDSLKVQSFASFDTLTVRTYTTAASNIYHGRHPESGLYPSWGDVLIMDAVDEYENMKNDDGTWLDSPDPDWVYLSLARWDGLVEDGEHGITELYMPVVTQGEPIDLIERAAGNPDSFEDKANLKFVDGAVYYWDGGAWQDVTTQMEADGILTYGSFFNYRELKWISTYDIDISELNSSPYFPDNGIIYAAHTDQNSGAIRLVNGAELNGPLTVATVNPLYTLGDYNSVDKKPAALLCDAYNVLSNAWDDANSINALNNRVASNTTVNVCFMTGLVPSQSGNYSGGLDGLPRMLEKWTDRSFTYRGSMVVLWESQQATGIWSYGGLYYRAPDLDWAFDTMYLDAANLPPGAPQVNAVQRGNWIHQLAALD